MTVGVCACECVCACEPRQGIEESIQSEKRVHVRNKQQPDVPSSRVCVARRGSRLKSFLIFGLAGTRLTEEVVFFSLEMKGTGGRRFNRPPESFADGGEDGGVASLNTVTKS